MQRQDNKVAARINLIKLPSHNIYEFELDQETDWVRDLLVELNENATEKSPEAYLAETAILIKGEITKKTKPELEEYLLVKGTIEAEYVTECIRTLKPMKMYLEVPFKACFIDEEMATTELFKDVDETFVDDDVYEIYFYTKRTIEFQEMLHEQIFLHYNQYPVLDADSKLEGIDTPES